jgi:menaquinone-dependent protoporphyrinogen oxidase
MSRVQVVAASRHGGTTGIAIRIGEVLRNAGLDVAVEDAATRPDTQGFDAYVIGSGVYVGSWLKDGVEFLDHNHAALAAKPVWLFSSGPLPGSTKETDATDPIEQALGPEKGPGSGGRQKIAALSADIHPREHRVFHGAFDPNDPPRTLPERVVRLLPVAKGILPEGDFREWDAIEAWARQIAGQIATEGEAASPVLVG